MTSRLVVIYLVFLGAVAPAGVPYTTVTHNVGTYLFFTTLMPSILSGRG